MEFTIRNHINTYVLRQPNYIKNYNSKYNNKKEFTINYLDYNYTFEKYYDDENKLILYSYDEKSADCVTLTIERNKKIITLTSFGKMSGCFKQESNIGSNLLKLTLKMIEKYTNYFDINKIILSDNSSYTCKTNEKLNMNIMMTLLTGDTWYGKYGFRPYEETDYTVDKVGNNIYNKNKKIMNTILVSDINLKKYLLKVNKKFPNEFTIEIIDEIITSTSKNKLLKDFLTEFTNKKSFDLSCKYFSTFYKKLFDDIGLKISGHLYGKSIL